MRLYPSLCRCARHSCLAKEDPDNDASTCCYYAAGGTGSLHERWPMRLIRPTLSACCDGSQLLLGIPSLAERLTNQGVPTAEPLFQCPDAQFRRLQIRTGKPGAGFAEDNLISASFIIA